MRLCVCTVVALSAVGAATVAGPITLEVRASSAPNAYGSPSWNAYVGNALNSLRNNLGNVGDRTSDPTAYEIAPNNVAAGEFMVTSFKSWRGVADPAAPFAAELGNRMHFGLHALGDGTTQFRLVDVTFEITSSDPYNALGYAGNFLGLDYSATRHGINWGPDRIRGTGDDIVYTSGNGTTLVDELVYVGVGNAFWPQPENGQTNQEAIDDAIAWVYSNPGFMITGTYWINGDTGSDIVTSVIPLPGPAMLGLAGLAGLGLSRRRLV